MEWAEEEREMARERAREEKERKQAGEQAREEKERGVKEEGEEKSER